MRTTAVTCLVTTTIIIASLPLSAATIHVPGDQPTIHAGLDSASAGDSVLVDCGTYYEHGIVLKSAVHLVSETGLPDCVVIDGQHLGRVFFAENVSDAEVRGFTISSGKAPDNGGGIFCSGSSISFTSCQFIDNLTPTANTWGGAIYCDNCSLDIAECLFDGNRAMSGGAIWATGASSLTVTDCTFLGNIAQGEVGGLACRNSSTAYLADCEFVANRSSYIAGAMCSSAYTSVTAIRCNFIANWAWAQSGAVVLHYSTDSFVDCLFTQNTAGNLGGAVTCIEHAHPSFTGCTFAENSAPHGSAVYSWHESLPTFSSCALCYNGGGEAVHCEPGSGTVLECSDVYGNPGGDWVGCIAEQYGQNGNFSEDPLFCFADNPEQPYSLHEGSPCLPENSPCGELVGALAQGCGLPSAVEAASWGAIKSMFR